MVTIMKKMIWMLVLVLVLLMGGVVGARKNSPNDEVHTEELWLRPLVDLNRMVASFQFSTRTIAPTSDEEFMHYRSFPKVMGQLLKKYNLEVFQLSFTVGKWNLQHWGKPFNQGPFGVELYASMLDKNDSSRHVNWDGLKAELSGIFSVSLNLLDKLRTFHPEPTLVGRQGLSPSEGRQKGTSYYGTLPREEFCTENLSPWIKMLPCRTHAGLGRLINPIKLASSDYNSMSIRVQRNHCEKIDPDSGECIEKEFLRITQSLTSVLPVSKGNWSLHSVLARSDYGADDRIKCPLAALSRIYTEFGSNDNLTFEPTNVKELPSEWYILPSDGKEKRSLSAHDMSSIVSLNLHKPWIVFDTATNHRLKRKPGVSVHRYLTGYGQVRGGIAVQFENKLDEPVRLQYQDNIPWFLRLYFHTMKIAVSGKLVSMMEFEKFTFRPGDNHGVPNELSFISVMKPHSTIVLSIQFQKAFMQFEEHPPDANRGLDVSAALATYWRGDMEWFNVSTTSSNSAASNPLAVYSEPLLVSLPTPDFSMPYNVITLTSTILAFFIGSMLNSTLRRYRPTRLELAKQMRERASKPPGVLQRFFQRKKSKDTTNQSSATSSSSLSSSSSSTHLKQE